MENVKKALETLNYINGEDYETWIKVGTALKTCGCSCTDWDNWSLRQPKYKKSECEKKWEGLKINKCNLGTLIFFAEKNGYKNGIEVALRWDSTITKDNTIIDRQWADISTIKQPNKNWEKDSIPFIKALFNDNEIVPYKVDAVKNSNEKWMPCNSGIKTRKAKDLIKEVEKSNTTDAFYANNKDAGAWIAINPFDGKGVSDINVVDLRHTLIESDTESLEEQLGVIRSLKLPCAAIVFSGSRSLHAIVKIEANNDIVLYKKRVDFIFKIMEKNKFSLDKQNKNPARTTRLPGVYRGNNKQYLLEANCGFETYIEWEQYIEDIEDNLPPLETFANMRKSPPILSPALIDDVLLQGHKMMVVAPSKAGKSFALIQLCIAIAEGEYWLRWKCTKGKVLYINLELDRASAYNRFNNVYKKNNIEEKSIKNIILWNLRGNAIPIGKLAPILIKKIQEHKITAVIIDPIYKIMTGDENSAGDVGKFANHFDYICNQLGASLIFAHHHSKGDKTQTKAIDRSSGSGVFGRDPDAVIDMMPVYAPDAVYNDICEAYNIKQNESASFWEIDASLREFQNPKPFHVIFKYPCHTVESMMIIREAQNEKKGRKKW